MQKGLTISEIIRKSGVDEEVTPEILDIINELEKHEVIEVLK